MPRSRRADVAGVSFALVASVGLGVAFSAGCRSSFVSSDQDDASAASGVTNDGGGDADGSLFHVDGSLVSSSADGIEGVACMPLTCVDRKIDCGASDDGCGHAIDCGTCSHAGSVCAAGICTCTPKTCADYPDGTCGDVSDGCGGVVACATCPNGHCVAGACSTATCSGTAPTGSPCGDVSDGCGGSISLGGCTAPASCGGGGTVNQCGCTKLTCEQAGAECGVIGDGCGGQLSCGECSDPPGTCSSNRCVGCIAVPDPSLGYEARCSAGTKPHAWACSCSEGTCQVPDDANGASPSCALLATTAEHAVYCCTSAGGQ